MKRRMYCFCVLIILCSTTVLFAGNQQKKEGKLKDKKIVMIIAEINFAGPELMDPKKIFEREGAKVFIGCTTLSEAKAMGGGLKVKPDILLKNVNVKKFDAIVFVGGIGATVYLNDPVAHNIAKQAYKQGKILGALCMAPQILWNAGVPITSNNGRIFTAAGYAAKELGEEIVTALCEK